MPSPVPLNDVCEKLHFTGNGMGTGLLSFGESVNRTEEGISDVTLYSWLKLCRQDGVPVPGNQPTADTWSPDAKL
ncbi:hypothetical protein, partial [Oceanobacter antarcticus]